MADISIDTDYLIVGSGAVGMAFADTLLTETDARIVMVDRYAKPGGHWNVAYPFVTLHQPSNFYGVSSRELSRGRKDEVGLNKGLNELASGAEVSAYFDEVMQHQFLPTGRVQYFPMCDYIGNGNFVSKVSGKSHRVSVRHKTVDATYLNTSVPATHTPGFRIADGVQFMPLNDLPKVAEPPAGYVVIGGGKTGIDACLWLLQQQVDPDAITWIMPRDAWLLDRRNAQPTPEFFMSSIGAQAAQFEAIAQADSITNLFERLEAAGVLLRIYPEVTPSMFHAATISELELKELQRIRNVVRLGRVTSLETDRIVLQQGEIKTSPQHLHIDCSARAISNLQIKPIFTGDTVTPQTVRSYQPAFSAAFIAYVEANYEDEQVKNEICRVVPLPNHDTDWIRMMAVLMMNQRRWSQEEKLSRWLVNNRLDGFSKLIRDVPADDRGKQAVLLRMRENIMPAMAKLQKFAAEIAQQKAQA
jgi:hypothetical protein